MKFIHLYIGISVHSCDIICEGDISIFISTLSVSNNVIQLVIVRYLV